MPNIATLWILFGGAFIIATAGKSKELEINGQIRDREVRLIGAAAAHILDSRAKFHTKPQHSQRNKLLFRV